LFNRPPTIFFYLQRGPSFYFLHLISCHLCEPFQFVILACWQFFFNSINTEKFYHFTDPINTEMSLRYKNFTFTSSFLVYLI
jgi:hypothetical protein